MKSNPRILLLTGSYGNGHLQVVNTIATRFKEMGVYHVAVVDLFQEAHPLITKLTRYLYIKSFTVGKQIYGSFYYSSRHMSHTHRGAKWLNAFGEHKLAEIVETFQPDLIINTFPMLTVPIYKARTGHAIPTYNVLTDYGLHNRWTHPLVDRYYVACEQLKEIMVGQGIPADAIMVSGIPVHADFERMESEEVLCHEQGLDPCKEHVVIVAGAYGVLQNVEQIVRELMTDETRDFVIVCGRNHKLRQKLKAAFGDIEGVVIRGFVHDMDKLMKIASVMITKPGGITLTEALHVRLPLVLYRPVPGQERENALFFQEEGAAMMVNDLSELIGAVELILHDTRLREELAHNMARLCVERSAERICNDVLQHYTRNALSFGSKLAQ